MLKTTAALNTFKWMFHMKSKDVTLYNFEFTENYYHL